MNKEQLVATLKELFRDETISIHLNCSKVRCADNKLYPGVTFEILIDGELAASVDDTLELE